MKVGLLPMGPLPPDLLPWLGDHLAAYGIACSAAQPASLPPDAFVREKGRYDAAVILRTLEPSEGYRLAVTAEDLFAGAYTFVFGLADASQGTAVVSTFHLNADGPPRLRERLLKEALHELGHIAGRSHCPDPRCVMHFSDSLEDTDRKEAEFCGLCARTLPVSPRPRG